MPTKFAEPPYPIRTTTGQIKSYLVQDSAQFIQGRSSLDGEGISARYHVPFDNAWNWAKSMRGYAEVNGAVLTRKPPEVFGWPINPVLPPASQTTLPYYCTSLELLRCWGNGYERDDPLFITGFEDSPQPVEAWNNLPRPLWTEWAVQFSALAYAPYADDDEAFLGFNGGAISEWNRYTVIRQRPAAENERVPLGQAVYFDTDINDYQSIGEGFYRRGCITKLEVRWVGVPKPPRRETMTECSGKVNDASFIFVLPGTTPEVPQTLVYETHKLLFDTYEIAPVMNPWGQIVYDITYHFIAREDERTWNKYSRPDGTLQVLKFRHGAPPFIYSDPFRSVDFTKLFRFV